MDYILISFRSRTESIKFSKTLKENGIDNITVSTPKEANIGCGISVKTYFGYFRAVKNELITGGYKGYYLFLISESKGKTLIKPLR